MTYAGELLILFLASSSTYSILLTILHMSLAFVLCDAEMLTVCQLLRSRRERDYIPKQEEDGNANALCFLNTGIGLQRLVQILYQSFKLIILFAVT